MERFSANQVGKVKTLLVESHGGLKKSETRGGKVDEPRIGFAEKLLSLFRKGLTELLVNTEIGTITYR